MGFQIMIKKNTPKQKAMDILYKYMSLKFNEPTFGLMSYEAKQCALIAVENEYNAKIQAYNEMSEFCPDIAGQAIFYAEKERKQVKQEIEKL